MYKVLYKYDDAHILVFNKQINAILHISRYQYIVIMCIIYLSIGTVRILYTK